MESTRLHVYGKSNMDGFEHGPSRYSGATEIGGVQEEKTAERRVASTYPRAEQYVSSTMTHIQEPYFSIDGHCKPLCRQDTICGSA